MYLSYSPEHSSHIGRILNLRTRYVSPQFHVIYDDTFSTIPNFESTGLGIDTYMSEDAWNELLQYDSIEKHVDEMNPKKIPPLHDDWLTEEEIEARNGHQHCQDLLNKQELQLREKKQRERVQRLSSSEGASGNLNPTPVHNDSNETEIDEPDTAVMDLDELSIPEEQIILEEDHNLEPEESPSPRNISSQRPISPILRRGKRERKQTVWFKDEFTKLGHVSSTSQSAKSQIRISKRKQSSYTKQNHKKNTERGGGYYTQNGYTPADIVRTKQDCNKQF